MCVTCYCCCYVSDELQTVVMTPQVAIRFVYFVYFVLMHDTVLLVSTPEIVQDSPGASSAFGEVYGCICRRNIINLLYELALKICQFCHAFIPVSQCCNVLAVGKRAQLVYFINKDATHRNCNGKDILTGGGHKQSLMIG